MGYTFGVTTNNFMGPEHLEKRNMERLVGVRQGLKGMLKRAGYYLETMGNLQ